MNRMTPRRCYLRPISGITGKGGPRFLFAIALWWTLLAGPWVAPVRGDVDAAGVQRAIDRGVAYLRKTQNVRGGWAEYGDQSCGLSSLCTLALLNCGVDKEDPAMQRALTYLRGYQPKETYSVALQTLVFCHLGAARDLPKVRENVDWLVSNQKTTGRVGAWNYGRRSGSGDPSNTQFALLALGAAKERGIEVEEAVFQRSLQYWLQRQRGGGWTYGNGQRPTGSMTCAGIASVIIARGGLSAGSSQIDGETIRCCGNEVTGEDPVEAGLAWLGRNFSLQANPGGSSMTYFYYLYAFERVGRLSGRRFIGDHDWYREGAELLLGLQDGFQGFWSGDGQLAEANRDVATSFALLFLAKGKRQVVVGKLKHSDAPGVAAGREWNRHPEGLRHLVRHVQREWGRDLTWQTIDGNSAEVDDLLQAPVIVISGRQPLRWSESMSQRLRDYVEQGGCLLFEADGGDGCGDATGFEQSVRELCDQWYPGAPLERLPPAHPVWFAQRKVDPTALGGDYWMYGVQACCRTAIFYSPRSLSCRWQLGERLFQRDESGSPARKQIEVAVRLGENVIAYATGRELKDKLDQRVVVRGETLPDPPRGAIRLAMLGIDAGGSEARRALPNAASLIGKRLPIPILAAESPVGFDREALRDVSLLWVHGRTDFRLDATERETLSDFLANDGMILGTAICGSEEFAEAFRREVGGLLPDAPLKTMPPDHPALTSAYGGFDVTSVTIRTPDPQGAGKGVSKRTAAPTLEVATVNQMTSVCFSPLDISCALESQNSIQCPGYSTEDAAKIVANLVVYLLQQ